MGFTYPFPNFNDCTGIRRFLVLTHWGRVMHICVSKLTTIGSDNGLPPDRRQAIIWTNDGILLIGTLGTNFSEILGEIHSFSFKKMHLKMSSSKGRLFSLGLNELIFSHQVTTTTVEEAFQQQKSDSTSVSFHIDHTHQNDDCHRYKATIHMTAEMKEGPEDTKLSLRHDDFKPQTVTLADREFWGPVPLPRMAPNTKVKCLVASHRYVYIYYNL